MLLTNGVDEAIHLVCEAYLEPEDEALIVVPTFSMYEIFAAATGARGDSDSRGRRFSFPDSEDAWRTRPRQDAADRHRESE